MKPVISLILILLTLGILSVASLGSEPAWTYEVPSKGQQFGLPSGQFLPMSERCPTDVTVQVPYQGQGQSYCQIRYGQSTLARVAMVLDRASDGEITLYVDVNRNRKIEPGERQTSVNGLWNIELPVSLDSQDKRTLVCRFSQLLGTLSARAEGYIEGKLPIGTQRVAARRVDADANGQFADLADRIWLDLNADGQWDALNEQFTVRPILTLPSGRYAVAADRLGQSLVFRKLEGTGVVVLVPRVEDKGASIQSITASLIGKDGGAFALRGGRSELSIPVGQYRIYSLVVVARSGKRGQAWEYVFNYEGGRTYRWFDLKRNSRLEINPLDHLDLVAEGLGKTCQPGRTLSVKPVVFTGDGLRMNACTASSTGQDATQAYVDLLDAKGKVLASQSSGFA